MEELEHRCAVYVIRCAGGVLYKGSTRDMWARWQDHVAGRVKSTKSRHPLELVVIEYFDTFTEARQREHFFKSGVGRAQLKARVVKWQTQRT